MQIPWWNLLRRDLYLDVTLKDWRMVVENWADGAHLPKLKPEGRGGPGPKFKQRYVAVYARGGEFVFDDHANNWSAIARNLNLRWSGPRPRHTTSARRSFQTAARGSRGTSR